MQPQVKRDYYFKEKYTNLERFISYYYQIDVVRKCNPTSILFVGVGDGTVSDFLKKQESFEVTTIDIDKELHPDVVGDIRSLPFENNSFDVVCVFEVLEHMPYETFEEALSEIARVSKGLALISIPHRRTGFEFVLKLPFIRSLFGHTFLRLALRFPVRFPGFEISGQHYWEIDFFQYSLKQIRTSIQKYFAIDRETTPVLNFYLRFFTLRKKGMLNNKYVENYYDTHLSEHTEDYAHKRWFSGVVNRYDYKQTRRALKRVLGSEEYTYGIEVGPGDGIWTLDIAPQVKELQLIEQSKEMLQRAQKRLTDYKNISFTHADFISSSIPKKADLLVGVRCFEYFDDKKGAVQKMFEFVNTGGRVILITKNPHFLTSKSVQNKRLHSGQISSNNLVKMFKSTGFVVDSVYPATLRWKIKYLPLRIFFDVLHHMVIWARSSWIAPFFSKYAAESYVISAHRP